MQMKKRVLSVLLALCLAGSLASTAWAAGDQATPETADTDTSAISESQSEPAEAASTDLKVATISYTATVDQDGQKVNVIVDASEDAFDEGVTPVLHADLITDQATLDKAVAEVAEQTDTVFDSMTAFDIYFTDGEAEEEIEPNTSVSVRFELPADALPEGIDPSTLAVHHLAENQDDDTVTVETVATATATDDVNGVIALSEDAATQTEASADVARIEDLPEVPSEVESSIEDPAVVAEFAVDSFSTFTLTYNSNNPVTVYLVDRQGNQLWYGTVDFSDLSSEYDPTDFAEKFIANQWISIEELAGTWASKTEGYTYQGAYTNSQLSNPMQWIRYNASGYYYGWRYSNNGSRPNNSTTGNELTALYLVYTPVTESTENEDLAISDTVASNGLLTADYKGSETQIPYYVWEKNDGNSDSWQVIHRLKMNGDQYNLTENGKQLNAALEVVNDEQDDGGWWYRVSVYESQEAYESENSEPLATSAAMQLEYYDELRNGSFEEPVVADLTSTNSNYQYPVGTEGLIWKTTGSDQQVEIVSATNDLKDSASDYNNKAGAQAGNQYAELNCQAAGALYQDVLTVPGTTLNWQFSHRGRDGQDTMYLLIAPTEAVSGITTQTRLQDLISKIRQGGNYDYETQSYSYTDSEGYSYFLVTDQANNQAWQTKRGEYTVENEQYLTRFFFVAGDTASDNNTIGNLLDNVAFTTELLPAEAGSANLTVTKQVTGISAEDMADYTVTLTVDGKTHMLAGAEFKEQNDGSFVATWNTTIDNITANGSKNVTVIETPTTPADYNSNGSSYQVNGGTETNGTEATITLQEQGNGSVTFTNSYAAKEPPEAPAHSKKAELITTGANAGNYTLSLNVTGATTTTGPETTDLNVLMIIDKSTSMDDYLDGKSKISTVKTAAKNLVDQLEANAGLGTITYNIVEFECNDRTKSTLNWVADAQKAKEAIGAIDTPFWGNGTNWEAGIRQAIEELNKSNKPDAKTCVIFFTDGEPNLYINDYGQEKDVDNYGYDYDQGASEAADAAKAINVDYFFGIGAFGQNSSNNKARLESVVNASQATTKQTVVAASADDILEAFSGIAASITTGYYDVTISDTLSDYADFVLGSDGKPQFTIEITKPGTTDADGDGVNDPVIVTDEDVAPSDDIYSTDHDIYVSRDGDTFSLEFADNYMLKDGYTYTLSVIITPSDTAKTEYATTGEYPDTPDSGTGTHADAGEKGFYSNAEGQATLSYKHSSWTDKLTEPYDRPVIRVQTASLIIDKNVAGTDITESGVSDQTFVFTIQADNANLSGATIPTDSGATIAVNEAKDTVTLTMTGAKTVTISGLPKVSYTVTETGTISDVEVGDDWYYFADVAYGMTQSKEPNYEAENATADLTNAASATVTVTNKYEQYKTVTITKAVTGNMGDKTYPFAFTTSITRNSVIQNITSSYNADTWTVQLNPDEQLGANKAAWTSTGYTLANGESLVIGKVKKGDIFTVVESTEGLGYTVTYTADGAETTNGSFTVGDSDVTLTVNNFRKIVTPTGLESNHTTPYTLMVTAAGIAGLALIGGIVVRRRRRME